MDLLIYIVFAMVVIAVSVWDQRRQDRGQQRRIEALCREPIPWLYSQPAVEETARNFDPSWYETRQERWELVQLPGHPYKTWRRKPE